MVDKFTYNDALLTLMNKAGITTDDIVQFADSLGKTKSADQLYKKFTPYMTSRIAEKLPDIKDLNKTLDDMMGSVASTTQGAALKGPVFEKFVRQHTRLSRTNFSKPTFPKSQGMTKSRQPDWYVEGSKTIWDMKHTYKKLKGDELDKAFDYYTIRWYSIKSTNKRIVENINYLFPTKKAAENNRFLFQKYEIDVYFIKRVKQNNGYINRISKLE